MLLKSINLAFSDLFTARSRGVVLKSIGLTLILFFGVWLGMKGLVDYYVFPFLEGWTWLITILIWVLGAGILVTAGFLLAPVTAIFAGIFLDEVAENIEQTHYSEDPPGKPTALGPSILTAIQFGFVVLLANLVALLLVWLAGFGIVIFFLLNGYLLGREYFQFAAMRFASAKDATRLRKRFGWEVFVAGLAIAIFLAVPVLNLLTPIFATNLMVHLHKGVLTKL